MMEELPIVFLRRLDVRGTMPFCHDSYDFVTVASGRATIATEQDSGLYAVSDLTLIPPGRAYQFTPDGACTVLHFGLQPRFVEQNLGPFGTLVCDSVHEPNGSYVALKQLLVSIGSLYLEDAAGNRLGLLGLLYQLLDQLRREHFFAPRLHEDIPEKHAARVRTLIDYIEHHYSEPLTLGTLSEELFLAPQYLSRFFKKYLHCNFKDYLLEKRLFYACRDLRYTDDPITAIAIRHGFSDVTALSKAFRGRYRMPPSQYRRAARDEALAQEYDRLERYVHPVNEDAGAPLYSQAIEVDTGQSEELRQEYCALINICNVKNLLSERFRKLLLAAKPSLGFCHVRMQGVISSAFIPKVLPDYNYYFLDVENVMRFLQANGLTPFIELTQPPYVTPVPGLAPAEPPATLKNNRFFQLLEVFLKFCSMNYPRDWTAQWSFELWKSPKESPAQYAADFRRVHALLRAYLPGAELGGPGFDMGEDPGGLEDVLRQLHAQDVRPSFVSAYGSLVRRTQSGGVLSAQRNFPLIRARQIRALLQKHYGDMPFYLTAWSSVLLPELPVQYSCFQSAFICKTCLDLNAVCDRMGYWMFYDAAQPDPLNPKASRFWGTGLVGRDGIAMPSFYAFQMLARLGRTILCKGENYCVTKSGKDHYQILCYNYAHLSASAALDANRSFAEVYQLFEQAPEIQYRYRLSGMTPGKYKITRFILDRAHGSILDIWLGGFARSNIDEAEYLMKIELPPASQRGYLLKACVPEERVIYQDVGDALEGDTSILAHNVCVWDIIRQL